MEEDFGKKLQLLLDYVASEDNERLAWKAKVRTKSELEHERILTLIRNEQSNKKIQN